MSRGDTLASGGHKASWGPLNVSQDQWDAVFGSASPKQDSSPLCGVSQAAPEKPPCIHKKSRHCRVSPDNLVGYGRLDRRAKIPHKRGKGPQSKSKGV